MYYRVVDLVLDGIHIEASAATLRGHSLKIVIEDSNRNRYTYNSVFDFFNATIGMRDSLAGCFSLSYSNDASDIVFKFYKVDKAIFDLIHLLEFKGLSNDFTYCWHFNGKNSLGSADNSINGLAQLLYMLCNEVKNGFIIFNTDHIFFDALSLFRIVGDELLVYYNYAYVGVYRITDYNKFRLLITKAVTLIKEYKIMTD